MVWVDISLGWWIRYSGDIAKAFAAGADFVMLGGMLAGHEECEGEVENDTMTFYGMSSDDAQLKYYGEKKPHRAAEGKKVQVPYRGRCCRYNTRYFGWTKKCMYLRWSQKYKIIT